MTRRRRRRSHHSGRRIRIPFAMVVIEVMLLIPLVSYISLGGVLNTSTKVFLVISLLLGIAYLIGIIRFAKEREE